MLGLKTFRRLGLALALALTLGPASASADSTTFSLNGLNIGGYTGPYGSVTVSLTSASTATLTLTSNQVGGNVYLFGDGGTFGFNTNGAVTVNTVVGSNSYTDSSFGAFQAPRLSAVGAAREDGWGVFNQTINDFGGYKWSASVVTVKITKKSGTWSSAANVLAPVSLNGPLVAGHVFIATMGGDGKLTNTGITGFAANLPEPSTLAIAGLGACGFVGCGLLRRLKK